jgi:hypothetical protein
MHVMPSEPTTLNGPRKPGKSLVAIARFEQGLRSISSEWLRGEYEMPVNEGRKACRFALALIAVGFVSMVMTGLTATALLPAKVHAQAVPDTVHIADAVVISEFGGRPAFSPDGERVAFVGKTYGDAFEVDLESRKVRNLTGHIPHHGVVRVQYLQNGDYLITAPRIYDGPNTRAHLEMWVLDKNLQTGLHPLDTEVFEGIAVSRRSNLIAWSVIEPKLGRDENWQLAYSRPAKHYMAEVAYRDGVPYLANKREILHEMPKECVFIEAQDFRDQDRELVYSCVGPPTDGPVSISTMGAKLPNGPSVAYFRQAGTYAEVEGVSPDGSWATVECGSQAMGVLPPLDICRLPMRPNSQMTPLVVATSPGNARGVSNSVVSPDGRWIALQRSDSNDPDIGGGAGVYLLPVPQDGQ